LFTLKKGMELVSRQKYMDDLMEQYVEFDTERLQNICIRNACDSISFLEFLLLSSENGWVDYSSSANRIITLFTSFGYESLIEKIMVSPCYLKDYSNKIEFTIMDDNENQLYLSVTIIYDLTLEYIMTHFCEYNAKISDNLGQAGFFVDKTLGPFFVQKQPILNQEFSESFRISCYRISKAIKNDNE